ncbi:MAG TPA: hypothetical protein VLS45_03475 [Methylomicrobium sp.]|jgi:hypothetical protein|nr:hypothetical protein [Methylomicrobium sp.]
MFWTGFILGIFLGANLGIVIAGMLAAAKRNDAENLSSETTMDVALMDEVEEIPGEMPPLPEPVTYLDRYPHS